MQAAGRTQEADDVARYLGEHEVAHLANMEMALEAVEVAFRDLATEPSLNRSRQRVRLPGGVLHTMSGAVPSRSSLGLKTYASFGGGARQLVLLYDGGNGRLLAMLESSRLGQLRTGAASGVATRFLAREDAQVAGQIGCGHQAEAQLVAVCAVRPIRRALVYSRQRERREGFAARMARSLGVEVQACESVERVVREADVLTTITTSAAPLFPGEWLPPGVHVNAAGSNWAHRRELDEQAVGRASVIAADALDQARIESGDLVAAVERGTISWERVVDLGPIVAGRSAGRTAAEQITLFESQGLAVQDVALASAVYERALQEGLGQELPVGGVGTVGG